MNLSRLTSPIVRTPSAVLGGLFDDDGPAHLAGIAGDQRGLSTLFAGKDTVGGLRALPTALVSRR